MEDIFLSIQWSRFLLEKLKISSLFKKSTLFYGVRSVFRLFVRTDFGLHPKSDEST
jgi:hypothetical protein